MEARRDGQRAYSDTTEKEFEVLETQGHEYLSDMSDAERERFKNQQSQLWNLIPEKFRQKAENLARGY
jgi:hypothetical protein